MRGIWLGMDELAWYPTCAPPSGLIVPARLDARGVTGPTRGQARGPRWHRCAPRLYVPTDRPECVEQRIVEQAGRLTQDGGVTAWAALRWCGAAFFDGLADGGRVELPVPLVLDGTSRLRRHDASSFTKTQFAPAEQRIVRGLCVASIQRALFDEVVRRGSLWPAVQAIDMVLAARLISLDLFGEYVLHRPAWTGVPLARKALLLASEHSRSPRETWLRLVWLLVADLPGPWCNCGVFDLDGNLLGIPDLFDPVAGLVAEYNGAHHREERRHRADLTRETRFRDHGLEYAAIVQGDSASSTALRLVQARARAKFLPPESCAWTLERPPWSPGPESLDDCLRRTGRVNDLLTR